MVMVLKKFWQLPPGEKVLFWEALYRLLWARLAILIFPFRKIAPRLGEHMKETPKEEQPQYTRTLMQIAQALRRAGRYTPWESACLVQSIAGKMMLKRRKIPSTLYLGVTKEKKEKKKLKAHAWLRSGNIILTGQKGVNLSAFTVVSMFG
ncbi:MAG: lasso peptide biosynthesis B2 protein [Candidatus Aminicenantes bacterium]